jgi:PEP-CTERM motif
MFKKIFYLSCLCLFGFVASAKADTVPDPLHGCFGSTPNCTDNGTNTPTSTNPPEFGFTVSPGPAPGDLWVDFLEPNNVTLSGPITVSGTLTGTATEFSTTAWTSGDLDTYLGISASPANPIGAFLPSTQTLDPGATGFFVYQVNLGTTTLNGPSTPTTGLFMSTGIPEGSYIDGFFNEGTAANPDWVATANSGAIFLTGEPTPTVPEPGSLLLVCTGLVGAAIGVRRRFAR